MASRRGLVLPALALVLMACRPAPAPAPGPKKPAAPVIILPAPATLTEAKDAIERACQCEGGPLMAIDHVDEGREVQRDGHAFGIQRVQADAIVNGSHSAWRDAGFYLFVHDRHVDRPDEVAVLRETDKYEVMRLMGSNADNYGMGPEELIAWLRKLEREQPFELTGVGFDSLEGRFLTPVKDPDDLAKRMYAFCPDIVDQGVGTVAELARILRDEGTLYFWWD